jgi:predicted small secreted protein
MRLTFARRAVLPGLCAALVAACSTMSGASGEHVLESSSDQPSSPAVVAQLEDEAGDVEDPYEDVLVDTPDYVDALGLTAAVDTSQVEFRLRLADTIPDRLDPSRTTLVIGFILDLPGGEVPDFAVKVRSQDEWRPTFFAISPPAIGRPEDFPGTGELQGGEVVVRLDRSAIGEPESFKLNAAVAYEDYPDPEDPLVGVSASDGIPDDPNHGVVVTLR